MPACHAGGHGFESRQYCESNSISEEEFDGGFRNVGFTDLSQGVFRTIKKLKISKADRNFNHFILKPFNKHIFERILSKMIYWGHSSVW